ncbi:MAG: hypothetical protein MRY21_01255 [Simkaniaceae bacterium]|nr:hypothetical protein [Simkaniaceae bacterium]
MVKKKPKKIMILTLSGGGGHLQAAKAKYSQLKIKEPTATIIQQDLFLDWFGPYIGGFFSNIWNVPQKKGLVRIQEFLANAIHFADKLFAPVIFVQALRTLLKEDIDHIIDTQPMGTPSLLRAMHIIYKLTNKEILLEKIITELPTKEVTLFFKPIKKLSLKYRSKIRLITTYPLLDNHTSAEDFWQEQCGLSETDITYEALPLRPHFAELSNQQRKPAPLKLRITTHCSEENALVFDTISRGAIGAKQRKHSIDLTIKPDEKVSIVMLGSKPHETATIQYVEKFINACQKQSCGKRRDHLFVFCSASMCGNTPLQKKVHELVKNYPNYPKNLTIIPLSYQDDEVIAPLFFRSDATFTRSGGLTSMELLSVCQGHIWIHAEEIQSSYFSAFDAKMPHWEEGNAYYLKIKKGAEFINPETFQEVAKPYFLSSDV